jgi:hypothetical protein
VRRLVGIVLAFGACGRIGFDSPAGLDGGSPETLGPDATPLGRPDLWFKLNDSTGGTLRDDGLLGMDATITGTFLLTGTALRITAADVEGVTPSLVGLRRPPLTLSAWVTPALRGDRSSVMYGHDPFPPNAVSSDIPNFDGMGLGVNVWSDGAPGSELAVGGGGVNNDNTASRAFTAGTRYHVVAVYTTEIATYVDGEPAGSISNVDFNDDNPGPLYLGIHNEDNGYLTKRYFLGEIDDVRVYKLAASPEQIALLHAAGPE